MTTLDSLATLHESAQAGASFALLNQPSTSERYEPA